MRIASRAIGVFAALLVIGLIAFESYAVWKAKQRTPQVLAAVAKGELKLSDLPRRRLAMLLKVEDPNFYRHRGVDFTTPGAGMTTITQSLVKRFYFDRVRPGFAKIEQSLIARFVLDPSLAKNKQLQAYLNFTYFGSRKGDAVTGYADAARTYYGRELAHLSDREFLSLVAMTMAPKKLDPIRYPQANAERVRRIEALLAGRCQPDGLRDVTYKDCAKLA